jgi:hypothetical protein
VQFSASSYSVTEECTAVQLTVTRSGDLCGAATVDYSTSDGSAAQKTDYEISSGTVKFASGESSKDFLLLITEDHFVETAEQFNVALSNPAGATLGTPNTATVTINDDDVAGVRSPARCSSPR